MITAHDHFRRCVELSRAHGLGRIEVANLAMIGATRVYFEPAGLAVNDNLLAIEAARRVRHRRAELIARGGIVHFLLNMGDIERARPELIELEKLIRSLGARRFEAQHRLLMGELHRQEGRGPEAVTWLREGLAISRQTGFGYLGPGILASLALATDDPDERQWAVAEAERGLAAGAVSHNHFWFYRDAMETALNCAVWTEVDRYAAALEDYTASEPLPWASFFIARGRALAAVGRGRRNSELVGELHRIHREARRLQLKPALEGIAAALDVMGR